MFNKEKQSLSTELLKVMSEKSGFQARLEAMAVTLDEKNKEIGRLIGQVERLQDALVASSAPRAYEDRRNDQEDNEVPTEKEINAAKRRESAGKINAELLHSMEQPMFKDADDMFAQLLGPAMAEEMMSVSSHGNSES